MVFGNWSGKIQLEGLRTYRTVLGRVTEKNTPELD